MTYIEYIVLIALFFCVNINAIYSFIYGMCALLHALHYRNNCMCIIKHLLFVYLCKTGKQLAIYTSVLNAINEGVISLGFLT